MKNKTMKFVYNVAKKNGLLDKIALTVFATANGIFLLLFLFMLIKWNIIEALVILPAILITNIALILVARSVSRNPNQKVTQRDFEFLWRVHADNQILEELRRHNDSTRS
jgi:hypothetical protein